MTDRLIEMYEKGLITGYQVMMDCLHMLDPEKPELVLCTLPQEILEETLAYAKRYDPGRPSSSRFILPSEDQVRAAEKWSSAHRVARSDPLMQHGSDPEATVLRTEGVKSLVGEILHTMPSPYSDDIIDEVFQAIETNAAWHERYLALCDDLGVTVVNNWVGMWISRVIGRKGDHQVKAKSSLIESYSKLYP